MGSLEGYSPTARPHPLETINFSNNCSNGNAADLESSLPNNLFAAFQREIENILPGAVPFHEAHFPVMWLPNR